MNGKFQAGWLQGEREAKIRMGFFFSLALIR